MCCSHFYEKFYYFLSLDELINLIVNCYLFNYPIKKTKNLKKKQKNVRIELKRKKNKTGMHNHSATDKYTNNLFKQIL